MVLKKRKFFPRILILILLIGLIPFLYFKVKLPSKAQDITLNLSHQTSIENYLKIDVKPIQITQNKEIVFSVQLESYQNPDILDLDKIEMALLEDNDGNVTKPTVWKEIKKTQYLRSGLLYFPLSVEQAKSIKLTIFELEERNFEWKMLNP